MIRVAAASRGFAAPLGVRPRSAIAVPSGMGAVLTRAVRAASWLLGGARPFAALPSGSRASAPLVVVGLGNPGSEYEHTRHNVGFMTVDALKREVDCLQGDDSRQDGALVSRCAIRGVPTVLAKPQSFMNLSGGPISRVLSRQGAGADRLVLVYDDLDTPLGRVRVRATGGAGGHNGVKSTLQAVGGGGRRGGGGKAADPSSVRFARVKIGIGRPTGSMAVADYVLSNFRASERELLQLSLREAADAVRAVAELGVDRAVSGARVAADGSKYVAEGGKKEKGGNGGGAKQARPKKKADKPAAGAGAAMGAAGGAGASGAGERSGSVASSVPAGQSSSAPASPAPTPSAALSPGLERKPSGAAAAPLAPGLERKPSPPSSPLAPGLERKRKAENGEEDGHDAKRSET